jgi:hypothetical protein
VSIETKIAREVPLTRPHGDQETAVQLLDLGVEVRRLEKEFALIQALLENKAYWPKEDLSTQTNNKRRSGTCAPVQFVRCRGASCVCRVLCRI